MSISERLAFSPELRDTDNWPAPDMRDIADEKRAVYSTRRQAVISYLNGATPKEIEKEFGIQRSEIYRMLDRCLTTRPNSTLYGFYALIPGYPVRRYERKAPITKPPNNTRSGLSGVFVQLLSENDDLRTYVENKVRRARIKSARSIAKAIRPEFLRKCAKFRAPNEYPFNTREKCTRALVRYIKRILKDTTEAQWDTIDETHPRTAQPSGANQLRPYQECEDDGHIADFYFVIKSKGFHQEWVYITPMRIWLVLLVDRASRCILGYSYRLGSTNYSAVVVLRSFAHAIVPWMPKEITLPHLAYNDGAGFPSGVVANGAGRLVDLVCVDNAWANYAALTVHGLTRVCGSTITVGRASTPIARSLVERVNGTLETTGFRRLPTGFDPNGPKEARERALAAAKDYAMTIDELEQVIDVIIANYNAERHPALINRSPLEFLSMWEAASDVPVRATPDPVATALALLRAEYIKTIRGGGKNGRSPYVELWGARYTNDSLGKMKDWIGTKIRVVADIDADVRFLRGFVKAGDRDLDIGILKAGVPWDKTPHTLEQRKILQKAWRSGDIAVRPGSDLKQTFAAKRRREAEERRSAATALAQFGKLGGAVKSGSPPRDARTIVAKRKWISIK